MNSGEIMSLRIDCIPYKYFPFIPTIPPKRLLSRSTVIPMLPNWIVVFGQIRSYLIFWNSWSKGLSSGHLASPCPNSTALSLLSSSPRDAPSHLLCWSLPKSLCGAPGLHTTGFDLPPPPVLSPSPGSTSISALPCLLCWPEPDLCLPTPSGLLLMAVLQASHLHNPHFLVPKQNPMSPLREHSNLLAQEVLEGRKGSTTQFP